MLRLKGIPSAAIIFAVTFFLINFLSADEDKTTEKHIDSKEPSVRTTSPSTEVVDRLRTNFLIGANEGFDNNVFLDSSRKGDTFDEVIADLTIRYKLSEQLDIKAKYDFTSITYHEFTAFSMLDNYIAASFEYYPKDHTKIEAGYNADFVDYIKNKGGDFRSDGPFAGIKYYIAPRSYIGGEYQYNFYHYDDRPIRDGTNKRLDLNREDHRHNIIGELAGPIGKLLVKIKNTYYFNESNDGFMDYYDYQSEKIAAYLTYQFNDKFYLLANGAYQRKNFKSRKITTSDTTKEHDDIMTLGGGFYYNIFPSCYINANYTFRECYSNDPIEEYSGSIYTAGFNYFF